MAFDCKSTCDHRDTLTNLNSGLRIECWGIRTLLDNEERIMIRKEKENRG